LEKIAQRDYDLVLTDVKMPDVNGPELHARALALRPSLAGRFVFMRGHTLSLATREFLDSTHAPMLPKPASVEEVTEVVRRALSAVRARG